MKQIILLLFVLTIGFDSFAGYGSRGFSRSFSRPSISRSWSSSRSSYSYKPSTTYSAPKPAYVAPKPVPRPSTVVNVIRPSSGGLSVGSMMMGAGAMYLLTRPSHSTGPISKECYCDDKGVPRNCPPDVQCKAK